MMKQSTCYIKINIKYFNNDHINFTFLLKTLHTDQTDLWHQFQQIYYPGKSTCCCVSIFIDIQGML